MGYSPQHKSRVEEVAAHRGDTFVEEYQGWKVRLNLICRKGHPYTMLPQTYIEGRPCPVCKGEGAQWNNATHVVNQFNRLLALSKNKR